MSATYDGIALFGQSVTVDMVPAPDEVQATAFFGVSGVYSNWGGNRGRVITVSGVYCALDPSELGVFQTIMGSYADGIGRELYDAVLDITYTNVVFRNEFKWTGPYGWSFGYVCRPFSCVFYGLI